MRPVRKDMELELDVLKNRMRALIRAGAKERCLTRQLLRERERRIEDCFGQLDSMQTMHEEICKKFRKAVPESPRRSVSGARAFLGSGR